MRWCRGCGAKQNGLSDKALQCLLKDNVALVLVLELCVNGQQAGLSGRICVATTHIYQNQGFPNVKMWQVLSSHARPSLGMSREYDLIVMALHAILDRLVPSSLTMKPCVSRFL